MTKQVQLSDRAYRLLRAKKKGRESFSDVIIRSLGPSGDPMRLFGLGRLDPDERYVRRMRETDDRRAKRRRANR